MKITVGPISFDILLLLRLWWPATVFIVVCTGMLLPLSLVLQMLDHNAFIRGAWLLRVIFYGGAWLLLLIFYILLGVAFTYVAARLLRHSFGSKAWRIQRRMVIVSGFPFYALCFFLLMLSIGLLLDPSLQGVEMIGAVLVIYLAGAIGFALISCCYVILTLFFLRRSTAIAYQEKGK